MICRNICLELGILFHTCASQFKWSLIRSTEYPTSPMDLHGNCCLHKNCRLSPGMDHHGHSFLLYIAFCLHFLSSSLAAAFFFLSFSTSPSLSKAICICGNCTCLCASSSPTHKFLLMSTQLHHTLCFFFFNVASKTLAWRVDHWNTCQNWWWWSWITPEMVECWNLHDLVTLCMYHYWFEMGSLMDYQALF